MGLRLNISALFGGKKLTYCQQFYEWINTGRNKDRIYGFPYTLGAWCNSRLKVNALQSIGREDNIREIVLPRSEKENEAGREREREREREIQGDKSKRIPSAESALVQFRTQKGSHQTTQFSDFPLSEDSGATAISNSTVYGFPISIGRGNWCTQLKQRVFQMRH